ncbi:hypothetical protein NP590_18305 [Methylomonas sp. SURF-2]|uniref:Uncharacterized protein n=1 Tax=Methylomonas subterranea TaxID=2952225 RepID=A0ABT1TLH6_9GAMM|nr:hypothetical protein [Methylomonas sp. SURF-2]MCQ8106068.1 hypothetical protein [Methylomonas sp. SURF-2]
MKIPFFFLLSCWLAPVAADEVFSLALPECAARLEQRATAPSALLVRSNCALSIASLLELLKAGLPVFLAADTTAIESVGLGRLIEFPQWSRALARAAAETPAWNSRRGRPSNSKQNANQIVTGLLNQSAYLGDLQAAFLPFGLKACVSTVEKVLVFRARTIFQNDLPDVAKLSPQALLPNDAQVWLTLKPLSADCPRP